MGGWGAWSLGRGLIDRFVQVDETENDKGDGTSESNCATLLV